MGLAVSRGGAFKMDFGIDPAGCECKTSLYNIVSISVPVRLAVANQYIPS